MDIELMKALEDVNEEYKALMNSKEYKVGNIVLHPVYWGKVIKEKLVYLIFNKKVVKKIKNQYTQVNSEVNCCEDERTSLLTPCKSDIHIVIYTCVTGNYDGILEPIYSGSNIHYVFFTDNANVSSEKWEVRPIPEKIRELNNNTLINRYIKFHPHQLFGADYDFAIYVDGNVKIVSDLSPFVQKCRCVAGIAMHRHVQRICAYIEAEVCILLKKGNKEKIQQRMKIYREEGFPENFGLYEATVIATDLHSSTAKGIMNHWWEELLSSGTMRDQLCFPYVLWKNGFSINDVGCLGDNIYISPKFRIRSH